MARLLPLLLLSSLLFGEWTKDVPFVERNGSPLLMDIWVPQGKGPFPVAIIVHGGGFINGNKTTYVPPLFPPLIDAGFAIFTIDYRLAPKHPFPAAAEDVTDAIGWVKKNARKYKGDPKKVGLIGESAGGYLVAWAGTNYDWETRVDAVVDFYGPHDMVDHGEEYWRRHKKYSPNLEAFFGVKDLGQESRSKLWEASPYKHVKRGMPPFLFIHGTKDTSVEYAQSVKMCAKMRAVGADCEVFTVEEGPHGVGGWEKEPRFQAYKHKMVEWLRQQLR